MSKISASFGDRITVNGRQPFCCITIERDVDDELLERPALVAEFIKQMYIQAENAVQAQLERQLPEADESPAVNPAIARVNQPPPPPAALPTPPPPAVQPPANGNNTYYGGKGRNQDGPPTTGKQLRQWSVKNGTLAWFDDWAAKQTPPLPKFYGDWPDAWAVHAYASWQAASIPPAGPYANGVASH
jgi:hypothetical protein